MKVLILTFVFVFCLNFVHSETCEELVIPFCRNLGYNSTFVPSLLGHDNQEEAGLEVHQFWPLIEMECSPDFQNFACSIYAPPCDEDEQNAELPSRDLCESARAGCEPVMLQFGFPWPDLWNCENLTLLGNSSDELQINSSIADSKIAVNQSYRPQTQEGTCEELKIPMCKNLGYNSTFVPNLLGHDNQEEAGLEVHQFWPLIKIKCSPDFQNFVCSIYAPPCDEDEQSGELPSKELCESARAGCEPIMLQYGFPWPDVLNCENLTSLGNSSDELQINSSIADSKIAVNQSYRPQTQEGTCEELKIPMCKNLGYNSTFVPNLLGHQDQEIAGLEAQFFSALVKVKCSPNLQLFICSIYAPPCDEDDEKGELPSKDLCESARAGCEPFLVHFGFNWPDVLNCERYTSLGNSSVQLWINGNFSENEVPVNQSFFSQPEEGTCEELTIPMCKNLGYNSTFVPNLLGHQNQETAGSEAQFFSALITVKCSPDVQRFICSLYAPPCDEDEQNSELPSKDLCESVRAGCEPFLVHFGFNWPDALNCENFTSLGNSSTELKGNLSESEVAVNQSFLYQPENGTCEKLTILMCENLGYNLTFVPNVLGHQDQEVAGLEVHQFFPLVKVQCSPDFQGFICSVYAPPCEEGEQNVVLPSRDLCERARAGCEPVMLKFGFNWPTVLNCENFF